VSTGEYVVMSGPEDGHKVTRNMLSNL